MTRLATIAALAAGALGTVLLASGPLPVAAQQSNPGFFVPGQGAGGGQGGRPAPRAAAPAPRPPEPPPEPEELPLRQVPMPPVPDLPALPRGASPPVSVIGVIGIPEVMRASVAAQDADRIISERRDKLNEDAQKEQNVWRDMQQALARDRAKLTPDQIRGKERELQERITTAQRKFRERNRVIQEAAQFAINQVQASLIGVIRQVADSRGMNLVLHRNQVALNVNEFDISEQVAEQLNKVLPTVNVPPEDVSPAVPAAAPAPQAPAQPPSR